MSDSRTALAPSGQRGLAAAATANPLVLRGFAQFGLAGAPALPAALALDLHTAQWHYHRGMERLKIDEASEADDSPEARIHFGESIRLLDGILRHDPQSAVAYRHRGKAWVGMAKTTWTAERGDYDMAIPGKGMADFDQAIRLDPSNATAYYLRSEFHRDGGDTAAHRDLDEAIRLNPTQPEWLARRARHWERVGDTEKALKDFDEVVRLDPTRATAYAERGQLQLSKGNHDKAIRDFNEAIRLNLSDCRRAYVHYWRGKAWEEQQEYDKAIDDFGEAIQLLPSNVGFYKSRGCAWMSKEEYDRAVADFTSCIHLRPTDAEAYSLRGRVWWYTRRYANAIRDYEEAIRLAPTVPSNYRICARLLACCPEAECRDGGRAIELATRACDLDGASFHTLSILAEACAEAGRFDEAVRYQFAAREHLREHLILLKLAPLWEQYRQRLELYKSRRPYRFPH